MQSGKTDQVSGYSFFLSGLLAILITILCLLQGCIVILESNQFFTTLGPHVIVSGYCESRPEGCSDEARDVLNDYVQSSQGGLRRLGRIQTILQLLSVILIWFLLKQHRHFLQQAKTTSSGAGWVARPESSKGVVQDVEQL